MSQTYKKKLIEVAIPLEAINAASAREKSIRHGHPSTLHLWWARRPLAACRAILFAQLVDDPTSDLKKFPTPEEQDAERRRLFKIIEELVIWENSTNQEVLERARTEIKKSNAGETPLLFDPFSGSGSIPLEAQRLGLSAYGSDLNPVAVVVAKATVEIPSKFKGLKPVHPGGLSNLHYRDAQGLAEDIKYYGRRLRERVFKKIGHLYPGASVPKSLGGGEATVVAWIWARTVPSPDPAFGGLAVPLVRSFLLSDKEGDRSWVEPIVENGSYRFVVRNERIDGLGGLRDGTVSRQGGVCLVSGGAMPLSYIREQAKRGRLGQKLMAVVAQGPQGRIFLSPRDEMEKAAECPEPARLPEERVTAPSHEVDRLPMYGMETWGKAFTNRQGTALTTFVTELRKLDAEVARDCKDRDPEMDPERVAEYVAAVRTYLACALDRCADAWSTIATWATDGFIRFTFARQAIAMTWDFAECNVFSEYTGNFLGAVEWVSKSVSELPTSTGGLIAQADARNVPITKGAFISTDPPYYDNIGYADLSDYFYVWLKQSVGDLYPEIFSTITVPKSDELVAMPHRHKSRKAAEEYFLAGMTESFKNIAAGSRMDIPATIYYAFKQSEVTQEGLTSKGWATFLEAVIKSGFAVVGTWPVRTERAGRTISVGTNALATSVVLVCRLKSADAGVISRAEFIRALKRELPAAIADLQAANIAPADMPQSSIGPGMGIFSRYQAVLESDDTEMTVKAALELINRQLDEYLGGIQGELDADTRFAVTWFEQNGILKGDYGTANNIAQARGISVDSVKHARIIESVAGKVRILKRDELLPDWSPATDTHLTVWECCQYLIRELEEKGEYAAALLMKKIGSEKADAVKDLAYCLYDICSNKRKDAKEATSYNALIAVWADLTRLAAGIHDTGGDRQISMAV